MAGSESFALCILFVSLFFIKYFYKSLKREKEETKERKRII